MPRYSILGLMLFTLGIAGGLAAALAVTPLDRQVFALEGPLGFGLRVALSALETSIIIWVGTGLCCQAWDLFKYLRVNSDLPVPQRNSLRFDLYWRCGAVLIIPLTFGLAKVGKAIERTTDDTDTWAILFQDQHFAKVRWLLLLIAIGVAGGYRTQLAKVRPRWMLLLRKLSWPAGVLLVMLIAWNESMIQMLIYVALNGVEAAEPLKWQRSPAGLELLQWERLFCGVAIVQLGCLIAAVACSFQLAFRYGFFSARFKTGLITVLFSLAVVCVCDWWLRTICLPQISPSYAEAWRIPMPIATCLLLGIVVTYFAAQAGADRDRFTPVFWRNHPDAYLHERRGVWILVGLDSVVFLGYIVETFVSVQNVFGFFTGSTLLSLCQGVLSYAETYWGLATVLLVSRRFLETRRSRQPVYVTPDFSWRRFCGFWFLFALLAVAAEQSSRELCLALWLPWGWY